MPDVCCFGSYRVCLRLIKSRHAGEAAESDTCDQPGTAVQMSGDYFQVLYIQMEFCPRTLRGVLSMGALPDASAWQVSNVLAINQLMAVAFT